MKSLRTLIGVALVAVAALPFAGGVAAGSAVVVRPGDVGTSWLAASSPGGSSSFVTGPATAPLGTGSLQFTTADIHAWAQLYNYSYVGTPLANLNAMSYSAYRASSSTNPTTQTIALALEVDVNGSSTAGGLATLIFEPDYQAGGNGAMKTDAWQTWDAYDGGNAVWWATADIPGAPVAYNTFVPWSTILAANPDAIVVGGVGLFVGSGWDGQFTGFADALTIGASGPSTTYDFEPKTQLVVTAPDASKVQGDPIPTLTPTYSGFLYGDTAANLTTQPTCATTASASSPVGTYPIICSGGASDNYTFTYTPGSLQVLAGETATPTVGPTQTATPTVEPTQIIEAATGTPSRALTPPPTSASGNHSSGDDSAPLWAVLICVAFASLGLFVGVAQRRSIRP